MSGFGDSVWGFDSGQRDEAETGRDGLDGGYFFGAAGTFAAPSAESANREQPPVMGGPLPGKQPSWPVPRARTTNYAAPKPKALNYAAIASRARTEDDIEAERLEAIRQAEHSAAEKEQQRRRFEARSHPVYDGTPLCHFYALGTCKYGQSCRYMHATEEELQANANADYGHNGADVGGGVSAQAVGWTPAMPLTAATTTTTQGLEVSVEEWAPAAPSSSSSSQVSGRKGSGQWAEASECGICMGDEPSDALWGVLSHCNCVFCLGCIREWRADGVAKHNQNLSTTRRCPLCRVTSSFVVPSTRTFTLRSLQSRAPAASASAPGCDEEGDEESRRQAALQTEKQSFINAYKMSLQSKPCRNFLKNGSCAFGSSCFYLHIDATGEIERDQKEDLDVHTKPRYLLNSAGETVVLQGGHELTLGELG